MGEVSWWTIPMQSLSILVLDLLWGQKHSETHRITHIHTQTRLIAKPMLLQLASVINSSSRNIMGSPGVLLMWITRIRPRCVQTIPKFVGVDFSFLFLVENAKHVAKFLLVFVVLHLLADDAAELVEQDVPGTYTQAVNKDKNSC